MKRTVSADGAVLAVTSEGVGAPVLVIQTALTLDENLPLMQRLARYDRFRVVGFDRRGYGHSTLAPGPGSIAVDVADCLAVLRALGVVPAHVVGTSFSAAVAMEFAATHPAAVRTLTLVEPPPLHVPAGPQFREAIARLIATYEQQGTAAALEVFMTGFAGPQWRTRQDALLPGSVAQMERDAGSFFGHDLPALLGWEFDAERASRVTAPVLFVGGSDSAPWFAQTRAWVESLFDEVQSVIIDGAGHDVALTHAEPVAQLIAEFVGREGGSSGR